MAATFFKTARTFAVVGASNDRSKYGNIVLRWYKDRGFDVTPVSIKENEIEGLKAVRSLSDLKDPKTTAVSVVSPPSVSEKLVEEAVALGIPSLWFQPGSASAVALSKGHASGVNILGGGPCILVSGDEAVRNIKSNL